MSTKSTLAHHEAEGDKPSWHFYEEMLESGVVYLELNGVNIELHTRKQGGVDVVLRLPVETARQLGLHTAVQPERWNLLGSVQRYDDPTDPVWPTDEER
ncbi:hypothetical protein [Paraburkholderia acidipaludis]|uniref:hypothetical protein n=1 Tax=Paraburkholderia acidipaludis TaxID=660537 RepID=UPI000A925047|nr:hypothetical protein [Paraburkholderia acidipaludis]